MYFWEVELRRWIGEGWSLLFPQTSSKGSIYKLRQRLVGLIRQMQKIPEERAKAEAKAKAKAKAVAAGPGAVDLEILEEKDLEEDLHLGKKMTKLRSCWQI